MIAWFRCGLLLLLSPTLLMAQYNPSIEIKLVKVGLPAGQNAESGEGGGRSFVVKNNTWAPVYVWFEILKEVKSDAAIVIETTDTDDLTTRTFVPLQNLVGLPPGTLQQPMETRCIPYVRTSGSSRGEIKVTICVPENGVSPDRWTKLSAPLPVRDPNVRNTSKYAILSLGSDLAGFKLPNERNQADDEANDNFSAGQPLRNGRIETAKIKDVAMMPDQWYGYEAADLVVLSTLDKPFLEALFTNDLHKPRLNALLEWVRRGGKLIVGVGSNAAFVAQPQFDVLREILPATIPLTDATVQVKSLSITWGLASGNNDPFGIALARRDESPFAMANAAPKKDRATRLLAPPEGRSGENDRPTVLQWAYGMGRVTLVAFDLDTSPFVEYVKRGEFWNNLLNEAGSAKSASGSSTDSGKQYTYETEDDIATMLRNHIDTFEGVPVISFGWVAIFILLYTLVIGPIEYYVLKKVFGRLELTWITFPIIVLTVSAIAYFTAYAIKGKDLKINKVDVVDIDPASQRVYGRTWVTLFSPLIDTYRVGIDPNPGWVSAESVSPTAGSLVDWFGGTRSGSGSLLRGKYWYSQQPPTTGTRQAFADGLVNVPIPVWSTKAFTADWSAEIDPAKPLVKSALEHPLAAAGKRNLDTVAGEFTLDLPIAELKDVYLIYAGKAYKQVNPIRSGTAVTVYLDEKQIDANWLQSFAQNSGFSMTQEAPSTRRRQSTAPTSTSSTSRSMAELLFHDAMLGGNDSTAPTNSTLRRLDQSWRISPRNRSELIVVARLPEVKGGAEEVLTGTGTISPTRLWIRELPGDGKPRTAIPGSLKQDTYLRIFVPINR